MGLSSEKNRKPRLLIILNRFVIGGQAVDTIPLAYQLQKDFEILILFGEKEADEIEPVYLLDQYPGLRLKKNRHLRRSINPLIDLLAFFKLLVTIANFKADIVHTHGAKSGFLGRFAAFCYGAPVIIHTFHGHFFHSYFSSGVSRFVAGVERMIGKITTAAIALSETQKNELVNQYKILPARKMAVIKLGFEYRSTVSPATLRQQFREQYHLGETDIAVGIVGRIVPVKNHIFFVDSIKAYQQRSKNAIAAFFIIGDGELRPEIEDRLKQHNIPFNNSHVTPTSRVVFTSWLNEMDMVMSGLDLIVLTSLNEGTPLSIIEAQYFERAVVSTNVGGVKDTMIDALTGFLVDPNDLETFVEKMEILITNDDLRTKMGVEGRRFVEENFSKANEIVNTKEFYFSLLHKKGII